MNHDLSTTPPKEVVKDELDDIKHELCKHQRPSLLRQFNDNRNSYHESRYLYQTLEYENTNQYIPQERNIIFKGNESADFIPFEYSNISEDSSPYFTINNNECRSVRTFSVVSNTTNITSSIPKSRSIGNRLLSCLTDLFCVKNLTKTTNRSSETSNTNSCRTSSASTCESTASNNIPIFNDDFTLVSSSSEANNISIKDRGSWKNQNVCSLSIFSSMLSGISAKSMKTSNSTAFSTSVDLNQSKFNGPDSMDYLKIYSSSKSDCFNELFTTNWKPKDDGKKVRSFSIRAGTETKASDEMYNYNSSQKASQTIFGDSSQIKDQNSNKTDRIPPSRQSTLRFSCKIENPHDFHQSLSNKGPRNPYARGGVGHRSTKFSNDYQLLVESLILSG